MKILHITPTLFPAVGGIETVVRELMGHLRRRGFEADAMHIATGNRPMQERLDDSIVWRVPLYPNRLVGMAPSIRFILRQYDILHVHDPQLAAISGNVLVQGRGQKKVLSTHGGYRHTARHGWAKAAHWRWFAAPTLNQYDFILASSQSDYELFRSRAAHVRLVPNGVNVEKFLSIEPAVDPDPKRWIYWGRLARNKRLDLLIELVAQARERELRIDLLIAGHDFDGLESTLRARINALRLENQVRLAGMLSDAELMREVANRTVFVTATEHEGFGLSVIEAMAAGLIALCRDMPPLNAFVSSGENGLLLRFDQSDSDLSLVQRLCASTAEEILRMRRNARSSAHVHSWESAIEQYIDVYEELMSGKP
ncbi:MAG TPA: glycosyltransferase family 4 protein [Acidobacteriaceae bacterium]